MAERVMHLGGDLLRTINPSFVRLFLCLLSVVPNLIIVLFTLTRGQSLDKVKRPFRVMTHADAIRYCREHNIYKDKERQIHFADDDVWHRVICAPLFNMVDR